MKYLLLIGLLLTSCSNYKPTDYRYIFKNSMHSELSGVFCQNVFRSNCGVILEKCDDGHSYYCVQNVIEEKIK